LYPIINDADRNFRIALIVFRVLQHAATRRERRRLGKRNCNFSTDHDVFASLVLHDFAVRRLDPVLGLGLIRQRRDRLVDETVSVEFQDVSNDGRQRQPLHCTQDAGDTAYQTTDERFHGLVKGKMTF